MSFLDLSAKRIVIFGLANKKSVACAIAKVLVAEGAEVIHVDWKPAAGGNEKLMDILARMKRKS